MKLDDEKIFKRIDFKLILIALIFSAGFELWASYVGKTPQHTNLILVLLLSASIFFSHTERTRWYLQHGGRMSELDTAMTEYHSLSDKILNHAKDQFNSFEAKLDETKVIIGDSVQKLAGSLTGLQILSAQQRESLITLIDEMLQMTGGSEKELELEQVGMQRFFAETNALIDNFVKKIVELDSNSQRISLGFSQMKIQVDRITGLLNDISSITKQTDLLALNAAIEAARAGQSELLKSIAPAGQDRRQKTIVCPT